jgi:hypothetical protein
LPATDRGAKGCFRCGAKRGGPFGCSAARAKITCGQGAGQGPYWSKEKIGPASSKPRQCCEGGKVRPLRLSSQAIQPPRSGWALGTGFRRARWRSQLGYSLRRMRRPMGGQAARRCLPYTALTSGTELIACAPPVGYSASPCHNSLLSSLPGSAHPRCPGHRPPACPPVPANMRCDEGRCPLAAAASALHTASLGAQELPAGRGRGTRAVLVSLRRRRRAGQLRTRAMLWGG